MPESADSHLSDALRRREVIHDDGDLGSMRDRNWERGIRPTRKPKAALREEEPEAAQYRRARRAHGSDLSETKGLIEERSDVERRVRGHGQKRIAVRFLNAGPEGYCPAMDWPAGESYLAALDADARRTLLGIDLAAGDSRRGDRAASHSRRRRGVGRAADAPVRLRSLSLRARLGPRWTGSVLLPAGRDVVRRATFRGATRRVLWRR
jgi:hypothetical protein